MEESGTGTAGGGKRKMTEEEKRVALAKFNAEFQENEEEEVEDEVENEEEVDDEIVNEEEVEKEEVKECGDEVANDDAIRSDNSGSDSSTRTEVATAGAVAVASAGDSGDDTVGNNAVTGMTAKLGHRRSRITDDDEDDNETGATAAASGAIGTSTSPSTLPSPSTSTNEVPTTRPRVVTTYGRQRPSSLLTTPTDSNTNDATADAVSTSAAIKNKLGDMIRDGELNQQEDTDTQQTLDDEDGGIDGENNGDDLPTGTTALASSTSTATVATTLDDDEKEVAAAADEDEVEKEEEEEEVETEEQKQVRLQQEKEAKEAKKKDRNSAFRRMIMEEEKKSNRKVS
jgi:hypothetical protein